MKRFNNGIKPINSIKEIILNRDYAGFKGKTFKNVSTRLEL